MIRNQFNLNNTTFCQTTFCVDGASFAPFQSTLWQYGRLVKHNNNIGLAVRLRSCVVRFLVPFLIPQSPHTFPKQIKAAEIGPPFAVESPQSSQKPCVLVVRVAMNGNTFAMVSVIRLKTVCLVPCAPFDRFLGQTNMADMCYTHSDDAWFI